jgi:Ni/Fe-hydrogenase subunit HybB-like protein
MTDQTITAIIAGLVAILGTLLLVAKLRSGPTEKGYDNPASKASRIQLVILAITLIVGGLIVLIRGL